MFVGALLRGDDFCAPVTIRNMSLAGALLSAAAVPEEGQDVSLVRGSLTVQARVVWAVAGRCGIRFSSVISIPDWLAPLDNQEQTRIDEAVALIKAGVVPLEIAGRELSPQSQNKSRFKTISEDLARVGRLVEAVADQFASDPAVVSRHADMLQSLEIASQSISGIANSLETEDSRLNALRTSCSQALRVAGKI